MRITFFTILILGVFLVSCKQGEKSVSKLTISLNDPGLTIHNGVCYYRDKLFNGILQDLHENGALKSVIHYNDGRKNGEESTYYPDGNKETWRWFIKGEKDSVHRGWWPNGQLKFEYHFTKGNYNGLFSEWYQGGQPLKKIVYKNGEELGATGWRENGKLYMNYIMKDGRRYGIANANLCYNLVGEKVE